ncbi:hypothetical protein [Kitasatospora sp. HPMI-4]|uniref:hypothetical protein n=1 Tax=Kitasatospora sp. HPMI-4 TaxID=3448443 RepID=UPI003F1CA8A8
MSPVPGSAHAMEVADNLTCEGTGITLTLAQPVTSVASANSYQASGTLGTCYSQDGSHTNVDHGIMTASGSGTFDCVDFHSFTGQAVFDWYDSDNTWLGFTTVSYQGGERGSPGSDRLPNNETGTIDVTSTLLPLNTYRGSFAPTDITGSCADTGITAITGDYEADFSLL